MMTTIGKSALLASIPLLFACSPVPEEAQDGAEAAPMSVSGQAHYLERIVMPAGSWLKIEMLDEDLERVLASQRLDDAETPPFQFELEIEPGQWRSDSRHLLSLTLYLPDGSPRFSADVRLDSPVETLESIRLIAVEGVEEAEIDPDHWYGYRCGDVAVDARFPDPDRVILSLPWKLLTLEVVEAASGARYQGDEHEFWVKATDRAMLTLPEADTQDCRSTRHLSPWTRAIERGVSFRAFGNEPGWVMELTREPEPRIDLTLDYGTRELVFDEVEILPEEAGLIGQSPGNHARIEFIDEPCQDTMIGWILPVTVRMQLNEQPLTACGRFLD